MEGFLFRLLLLVVIATPASVYAASWNFTSTNHYSIDNLDVALIRAANNQTKEFVEANHLDASTYYWYSPKWHRKDFGINDYSLIYIAKEGLNEIPSIGSRSLYDAGTHYYMFTRNPNIETLTINGRALDFDFQPASIYSFSKAVDNWDFDGTYYYDLDKQNAVTIGTLDDQNQRFIESRFNALSANTWYSPNWLSRSNIRNAYSFVYISKQGLNDVPQIGNRPFHNAGRFYYMFTRNPNPETVVVDGRAFEIAAQPGTIHLFGKSDHLWDFNTAYYFDLENNNAMTTGIVDGRHRAFINSHADRQKLHYWYMRNWLIKTNNTNQYSFVYVNKERVNERPRIGGRFFHESDKHYYMFTRRPGDEPLVIDGQAFNMDFLPGKAYFFGIPSLSNTACETNSGAADDTGLKTWCWEDLTIGENTGSTGVEFSNRHLTTALECDTDSVFIEGNKLRFFIDPLVPAVPTGANTWCERDFNMRAEISTRKWPVNHALGTEEWMGWSYTFGDDYIIDNEVEWIAFQIHHGKRGDSPQVALVINNANAYSRNAGEIHVINSAAKRSDPTPRLLEFNNRPTGIIPVAGQTLDIVVHIIYGEGNSNSPDDGLLQVWIDGKSVYNENVRTVYGHDANYIHGGNAKWGMYKSSWAKREKIRLSANQGITQMGASMGPLRILTRRKGDPDYGNDAYMQVTPR